MKKKIIICLLSVLFLTACGKVELIDGKAKIVSFKDKEGLTAEALYEKLKITYGTDHLVNMIDEYLLEKEYDVTDEETKYIKEVVDSIKSVAEKYDVKFENYIKEYYGVTNEKDLNEFIRVN